MSLSKEGYYLTLSRSPCSCINSCRHSLPVSLPRIFPPDLWIIIGHFALRQLKCSCWRVIGTYESLDSTNCWLSLLAYHYCLHYSFTVYRFGQEYLTLQARVLKTLCEATAADKPLPTMFGGIVGVTLFGPKAVDAFLLPLVIPYFTKWQHQLENTRNLEQRFALQECQQAILVRTFC